uniref:MHC class II beta chain N-terminal domain-containing protein n=1 Tax=Amphiprion percula TaxID=161767 RepID=A0A3P8U2U5_AMPPE
LLTQAALNSLTTNCQHLHASCFLAGKHLLRFLTFCQRDVPGDGQDDIESDGDQLLYVDPVTYLTVPRLPEFEEQWIPDPGLAESAYVSLGTCKYNIPRAIKGEKEPPEVIGGYVYQMISDCEYGDNITDMVYFVKNIFNQKLNNIYDSRLGKYIGFGELGMKNAAHYNNQSWKMQARKVEVDTLCRYNVRLFRKSILERKGMQFLLNVVCYVHSSTPSLA